MPDSCSLICIVGGSEQGLLKLSVELLKLVLYG